ncbi:MAG: Zn-ribbon domain-containing OB-fold protein [Anaerolineales bacterium]|nr:MAG: Zn-ribbon domain-containing OB-fold protein [Anaerolineales bacterium]
MSIVSDWRINPQRYRLVGEVCGGCDAKLFPPRDICPECQAPAQTPFAFSGKGEVYSYSTVYHAPRGFEEFAPYMVALVRLEEGPLVTAQLTDVDAEEVSIGMPVEMVTRKLQSGDDRGVIIYGYKFRPAIAAAA